MRTKQLGEKLDAYFLDANKPIDKFIEQNIKTETFPVLLNRLREEKGLNPRELYKKAFIDRRLYSQIMGERHYQPSKNTAIAFGIALELPYESFKIFLQSAGFALNHNSDFDLVIKFCVQNGVYEIMTVNELLDARKLPLLRN
jgi:hypothetical protein